MIRLKLVEDTHRVDWIVDSLTTFAESIYSFVPRGFDAYVRVFHPAYLEGRPVSWAEIAVANRKQAHPGMVFGALSGREEHEVQAGVFDGQPEQGNLPSDLIPPLVEVLSRHTESRERCWFAVWDGWGSLRPELRHQPTFATPGREYVLLSGPLECASEDLSDGWEQSANIWWPDDHAWCVATEIDLLETYIGCSQACRDDLLQAGLLEALEVDPLRDWGRDSING